MGGTDTFQKVPGITSSVIMNPLDVKLSQVSSKDFQILTQNTVITAVRVAMEEVLDTFQDKIETLPQQTVAKREELQKQWKDIQNSMYTQDIEETYNETDMIYRTDYAPTKRNKTFQDVYLSSYKRNVSNETFKEGTVTSLQRERKEEFVELQIISKIDYKWLTLKDTFYTYKGKRQKRDTKTKEKPENEEDEALQKGLNIVERNGENQSGIRFHEWTEKDNEALT